MCKIDVKAILVLLMSSPNPTIMSTRPLIMRAYTIHIPRAGG